MATRIECLIVCSGGTDETSALREALREILEDDAPDDAALESMIDLRYTRDRSDGRRIAGVAVTFDDDEEADEPRALELTRVLPDGEIEGIKHAVKLEDSVLRRRNEAWARESFDIEMRLREALSLIFIDTYGHYFGLLDEVEVNAQKDMPPAEALQGLCENELFFVLFSDYAKVDKPRLPKKVEDFVDLVARAEPFDTLRDLLGRQSVLEERYAEFVASLRAHVDPVEKLRNAIAHNRSVSHRIVENYQMARETLLSMIDEFIREVSAGRA